MTSRNFATLFCILVLLNLVGFGTSGDNDKYKTDGISVGLVPESDDEDGGLGINGPLEITSDVDDLQDLVLQIVKETETGKEPVMNVRGNICGSLEDTSAPWHPVVKMMNIKECPISAGSYPFKDLKLEMGSLDPFMSRDMCGDYEIELKIEKEIDTLSCHILRVEISERQTED